MSINAPASPIEDAVPKGLVLSDVDKTLYRTTRAILDGIVHFKLRPSPQLFYAFSCWLLKKVYGREWFSEKVDRVYRNILTQNGPERMEEFYKFVAGKVDLHHDGAVALLQACMNAQLKMVFVTGNDAEYVKIFLEANGLANADTEIFGGRFEVEDGRYTGKAEGVNMGAEGKAAVVEA